MIIKIQNKTKTNIEIIKQKLFKIFHSFHESKKMYIIFIGNHRMKKMNFYYLKKNYSTDILSFPNKDEEDNSLGDVFISLSKISEQARKQKTNFIREICFLSIHGYLHLKGYNDSTKKDLQTMINIQEQILSKYNF
jgi:probable rRNA maturation factor